MAAEIEALKAKCWKMKEERDRALEWRDHDKENVTRLTADVKRLKGVQQKVYSALLDEREKVARLTAALENVMPIAESYLAIMPDRRGRITETVDSARAALKGGQDDR